MTVLFLLLDAFRHDYINAIDTPFLHSKIPYGTFAKRLRSTPGFTQRSAIYTGTAGAESGRFTMYTFDAAGSPFAFLRGDRRIRGRPKRKPPWSRLPDSGYAGFLKRVLSAYAAHKRSRIVSWIREEVKQYADNAPVAHIPLSILPEIGLSEDNRAIHLPGAFEQESIFDVFVEERISYEYLIYPVVTYEDQAVLDGIIDHAESGAEVVMGQFADSDGLVHHCGPSSPRRRAVVGEIDRKLREISARYAEDTTWIIIGDHGMTDVTREIDLSEMLAPCERASGVRMGRDYLLFLDSTMARFRWLNEKGRRFLDRVRKHEELLGHGTMIDSTNAREHGIPLEDRRYGDLIWRADLGTMIFPDYFHDLDTHNLGMHGYDSSHDDMKGVFLAFGPRVGPRELGEVDLIDVCPTICRAAGVRPPRHNQGRCLI